MCCSSAKWKREVVQDHKFDFVDVNEYHTTGFFTRFRYALVYIFVIKSFLVYISDVYTAIAMLANDRWSGDVLKANEESDAVTVPFTIGKWIFLGCIIVSFLLLAWESRKARMIIRSRDISYAFTNVMANNYYTMKSYDHFCFFSQIDNSKKKKDEFAFFVFFTFKGWKRLLLADAPRQVINALTLYSFGRAFNFTTDLSVYYSDSNGNFQLVKAAILCTMIFTVVVWCGSAILLTIAALMYIPLLCYIQGNLKEYCCHKIDKRIAELMKRKTKKRLAREAALAKREAAGDFRHLQDSKGRFKEGHAPLPQPTLPTIDLNDEELFNDGKSDFGGGKSDFGGSARGGPVYAVQQQYSYPPMPTHEQLYGPSGQGNGSEYGAPSEVGGYAHPQFQQGGYPMGVHALPNDSFLSFNDDKMSIKSHDPLMPLARGGNSESQVSLNRAPSYHTREDDGDEDGLAYTKSGGGNGYYGQEKGGQTRYAEPPYVQQYHQDDYGNGPSHSHSSHEYDVPSYPSSASHSRQPSTQPLNGNLHAQTGETGAARGYSMAGRSDITSYYNNLDPHGRASIADSSTGAFDLDDYSRQSHYVNQAFENSSNAGQGTRAAPRRGSNLDYLPEEEEVDESIYPRRHHQQGNEQQDGQQDWRR